MFHSSDIIGIANSDWDSKWIHTSGTMLSFQSAKQVGLSKLIYIYIYVQKILTMGKNFRKN